MPRGVTCTIRGRAIAATWAGTGRPRERSAGDSLDFRAKTNQALRNTSRVIAAHKDGLGWRYSDLESSIVRGIMNIKQLRKLMRQARSLRQTQPKAIELVSLARALGRVSMNRGKEPTWVSVEFPNLPPLSIPMHKGRDLPPGTRNSILIQLEDDMVAWEDRLNG